jgi:signal transduction histidine kinase
MTLRRLVKLSTPVWLLIAVGSTAQMYLLLRLRPDPLPLLTVAAIHIPRYVVWWAITPAVWLVVRRFPVHDRGVARAIGAHVLMAIALAFLPGLASLATLHTVGTPWPSRGTLWSDYRVNLAVSYWVDCVTYAAVAGVVISVDLFSRARDRDARAARLEAELAESRMRALSTQLHPHFLFNALNTVAILIRRSANDAALRTVLAYGALLRAVLENDALEVPLRDEIEFVRRYVDVEMARFPDTLSVSIEAPRDVGDALVPNLVLQPVVENALHHAFAPGNTVARLAVRAWRENGTLRIEVADNGSGLPPSWSAEQDAGTGLRNVRTRLRECYGDEYRLALTGLPGGGTSVLIELPYRTELAAEAK